MSFSRYPLFGDPAPVPEHVLSVSDLTDAIKEVLEESFPSVWVSGEISNFSRPQSGHCYFTLKDDGAQIRGVIWRTTASRLRFDLHDGMEVICRAQLDLYAPRGSYQLVVQDIQPKGIGPLELRLRQLREKLAAEGLFAPDRKRSLPVFPKRVAFVTSPTGAAIRDFLEVLRRRWHGAQVLVVPVRVQGEGAAEEIASAIEVVNRMANPVDILVVGRGGGSLEDLWAFNEEVLVRAVAASRIPVISAVGHEIDVTLCDLVADVRALTPTEAAERIAPATDDLIEHLRHQQRRLTTVLRGRAQTARLQLQALAQRRPFRRPFELVQVPMQQLDELEMQMKRNVQMQLQGRKQKLDFLQQQLQALSPLSILSRGYSITYRAGTHEVVRQAADLEPGQLLETQLAHGKVISQVQPRSSE